ncbi:MAG: cation-transporting P-type ATPase [Clostridia bacterium]|nr:cation-transporting P-type ATPase [Clostridia bacterium]MBR2389094.1 cation-transporting P-type ATPase [Clostridia bacterium]
MNEKWFLLSLNEIENKLKTNAASGLSRKAARWRFSQKNGKVFFVPARTPISYLGEIVSDFAYVMLLAMSFLALFFDYREVGTVTAVVLVLNLVVSFLLYYRSEFFCDSLERVFLPRCKVIREGRVYSVLAENVVAGDVILLQKGDIVPADARLVSSSMLKVKMLVEKGKYILLDKAAESRVPQNEYDPTRFSNTVHAASVVVSGTARAIVTATGDYTYVGAKLGALPSESKAHGRIPRLLTLFKNYCRRLGIILMLVILPFSVLSVILGNTTLSLFVSFMTALAIAATSMTQTAVTVCKAFYTVSMKRCLSAYEPSVVRSCDTMDKLADVKYLFVLDNAVFTDGILHFERSVTADGECSFEEGERIGKAEKRLAELVALYDSAQRTSLSAGPESSQHFDGAIKEFIERSSADKGALGIRCNITGFSAATRNGTDIDDKLFYSEFGEKYMLSVAYSDSIINDCSDCLFDGGRAPLDEDARGRLMNAFRTKANGGRSVLVFTVSRLVGSEYGERTFVGMLVFGEAYDKDACVAIEKIKALGVKPIFFKNTLAYGKVTSCGVYPNELCGEAMTRDALMKNGLPLSYKLGSFGTYESFSDKEICDLIGVAHANRERVAVCGFDERFEKIYRMADVYVSFSSCDYKLKGRFEEEIDTLHTFDDPARAEVAESERRKADVLIPRPDKKQKLERRGGFASLSSAFSNATSVAVRVAGFFRYLVCIQLTRLVLVMVPMLFGGTALDVRHIVLGGMIADLFVLLYYISDREVNIHKRSYLEATLEMLFPLNQNLTRIICFAGGALFASLLPEIVSLFPNVPKYIDKTEYSLVTFVFFHVAVFLCLKFDLRIVNLPRLKKTLKKKPRVLGIVYLSFMLVFCILCFTVPSLEKLFDIEGFSSMLYLWLSFVPPLLSATVYFFAGAVRIERPAKQISKEK